jgi:hypothetical protein
MININLTVHEYSALLHYGWGGGTGLCTGIMEKAIGSWYHQICPADRVWLHKWFRDKQVRSTDGLPLELQEHFLARYDPDNQYLATWRMQRELCYGYKGRYHLNRTVSMAEEFDGEAVVVEKIVWVDPAPWAKDLDKVIARQQYIQRMPSVGCPKCMNREQIQLLDASKAPAVRKCRNCKHQFRWEP